MIRSRARGMTLVEVLLSLGLLIVLTAFVMSVLTSVLGLWQAGERRGRGGLAFSAATERLRADLLALHNGPSGWMILDEWEAVPAENENPPWRLPRLRFLADGAGLPMDDPTGRSAVEVAWMVVPENARTSRLGRLVRITLPLGGPASLRDDRVTETLARSGAGLVLLDGVAHLGFFVETVAGKTVRSFEARPQTLDEFPRQVQFFLERVAASARRRPTSLDTGIGADDKAIVLRGTPPAKLPGHALIEKEWVRITGIYPRLNLTARGERRTVAAEHPERTAVMLPELAEARFAVSAGGRRIVP